MRYLSVCSGIEAATVAAHPLGWEPAAFAEIEPFPSAVLAHHYPTVPNLGDFTAIEAHHVGTVDLLVGGTPCQAFSVAGKRIGLDDPRGNLTLEFLALAGRLRPRWVVWENVPGVLSIDGGRTFGAILGALGQLGYGFAYRVLDAQHFGVPQRRRRVFVVGCAGGDWQRAAAVLFERAGLCGDSQASGEAGQDVAGYACGGLGSYSEGCGTLRSHGGDLGGGSETLVAHTLRGEGHDASEDGTGRGVPLVAASLLAKPGTRHNASDETLIAFGWKNSAQQGDSCGAVSPSLDKSKTPAVFDVAQITSATNRSRVTPGAASPTLMKTSSMHAIEPLQPIVLPCQEEATNASSRQDNTGEILRELRKEVGEKAFTEWRSRVLDPSQPPEILRPEVYGGSVRSSSSEGGQRLDDGALPCPESVSSVAVRNLWERGQDRRSPCRQELAEQLAEQLDSPVPRVPHTGSQIGVRRLMPVETERLQGFPDHYTATPYRGKPAADGPRYKAIGNSMAVPVMRWIFNRIALVDAG